MNRTSRPWKEYLLEKLAASEEYAAGYLNACAEENDPALLLAALRDVAEARGGLHDLAAKTRLGKEGLFRLLTENSDLPLANLNELQNVLGIQTTFTLKKAA